MPATRLHSPLAADPVRVPIAAVSGVIDGISSQTNRTVAARRRPAFSGIAS